MSNVVIGLPLTTIAATGDLIYMEHAGQDTAINVGNLFAYELDNSLVVTPAQVVAALLSTSSQLNDSTNAVKTSVAYNSSWLDTSVKLTNQKFTDLINNTRDSVINTVNSDLFELSKKIYNDNQSLQASLLQKLSSQNDNLRSEISQLDQIIVDASHALAERIVAVTANFNDVESASASSTLLALVTASSALAQQVTSLSSNLSGDISASASSTLNTLSTASSALASAITSLSSTLSGSISASASSTLNTLSTASSALASAITSVSTTLSGVSGSVTTLAGSVNGLNNSWSVKLDSNGYISGITSTNNGTVANLNILADNFTIGRPGTSNVTAFSLSTDSPPVLKFLGKISATSIQGQDLYIGSVTSYGPKYFALEGSNQRLVLKDGNNYERLRLGYLSNNTPGTDLANYGIEIFDQVGNAVITATGLGVNIVGTTNIINNAVTGAANAWNPGTQSYGYSSNITAQSLAISIGAGAKVMVSVSFVIGGLQIPSGTGVSPGGGGGGGGGELGGIG